MSNPRAAGRRSAIYDLGYRHYDGPRLGRRYAVRSLMTLSLRNTFGLGRGAVAKLIAAALVTFANVPALIQVALAALVPIENFEYVRPEEYYGFVQVVIVMFVAATASELVGNDRKNNTMPLYFSRPIERSDYVVAKVAALTIGLQAVTLVPLLLLFIGNWLGSADASEWLVDNLRDLPASIVSAALVSAQFASLGILIATFATKRALALVAVLGTMLLSVIATGILAELLPERVAALVMIASPIYVARATALVLFGAMPPEVPLDLAEGPGEQIAAVGVPGVVWIAACLAHIAVAVWLSVRRYRDTI
jgi:ABC-2 type transport system permease protein